MLGSIGVCIFTLCYIYYLWDINRYWKKRGVTGPKPWPIVGNYGQVIFRLKTEADLIQEIYEAYPEEKYVGIYIGTQPAILVRDVAMFRQMFGKDYLMFGDRPLNVAYTPYTKSLFVRPPDQMWKNNRNIFTTKTNNTEMRKTVHNITAISKNYLDYVDKLVAKTPEQNVSRLIERYFSAIAFKAVLGINDSNFEHETDLQVQARFIEGLVTCEMLYLMTVMFPGIMNFFKGIILSITMPIIKKRVNAVYSALNKSIFENEFDVKTFTDLHVGLQKGNESKLDDETVALHLAAMTIGLTVSGSTVGTFLAYTLAQNPDIQNKCYEEICQVFEKYNGNITLEALSEMKYFDMVIEETLRKYGLSYSLNRICTRKYRFPETELVVEPGTHLLTSLDSFRRDSKYFSNPDVFDPDRFNPENKDKIPLGAHAPFGYGPRICIGRPIAKLVLLMSMSAFLHRFKLEPSDKELKYSTFYRSRKPKNLQLWINIVSRV